MVLPKISPAITAPRVRIASSCSKTSAAGPRSLAINSSSAQLPEQEPRAPGSTKTLPVMTAPHSG
jgi:hypothetical protein